MHERIYTARAALLEPLDLISNHIENQRRELRTAERKYEKSWVSGKGGTTEKGWKEYECRRLSTGR